MMPKCPFFQEPCLKEGCIAYHSTERESWCHALDMDLTYKLNPPIDTFKKIRSCPYDHLTLRQESNHFCHYCGTYLE